MRVSGSRTNNETSPRVPAAACSNVDLIHYYEPAKECVKQWMGKV